MRVRVSVADRKLNAWVPESKVQVRLFESPGLAASPLAGATVSIARSWASLRPPLFPVAFVRLTVVDTVSL